MTSGALPQRLTDDLRAQSTWALANAYLSAAGRLRQHGGPETFIPTVYLLGHALELHLKSYLAWRGLPEKSLRGLGHDLAACLREALKQGLGTFLTLSHRDVRGLRRINSYYARKELEYFVARAKRLGTVEEFLELVHRVSRAVFDPITASSFAAMTPTTPPRA